MTAAGSIGRLRSVFRTRAALGLGPFTAPVMVYIPLGIMLGPGGVGLVSGQVLAHLDVVISVALAILGLFIGIAAGTQRGAVRRLMAASSAEALITIVVVGGASYVLLTIWGIPLAVPPLALAAALGICASASAAAHVEADDPAARIAAQVADLDDVLPIVLGSVALALLGAAGRPWALDVLLAIGAGLAIAASGWLLFERSEGAERGVYVLGTLGLLGGTASYLGVSPLLAGLAAGWFWALTTGHTDRVVANELRKVQHPLVVMLLVSAGASLQMSTAGVWLFAPYVVFRVAGKIIGGWTASRIAPGVAPSDLGTYLIPPGVIGIAFALNLQQVAPGSMGALVFAVSMGAIASEVLALLVTPAHRPA